MLHFQTIIDVIGVHNIINVVCSGFSGQYYLQKVNKLVYNNFQLE